MYEDDDITMHPDDALTDDAPAADPDLELLEAYLDDALDPAAVAALRVRLSADADLSALLAELRSQRSDRAAVYAALEPGAAAVDRFGWRLRGAVAAELNRPATSLATRPTGWWKFRPDPWSVGRFATAAAACVLLGFFGGRLGRGPAPSASVATTAGTVPHVIPEAVASTGSIGNPAGTSVDVPIVDDYGRIVARQQFDSADKARQFDEELRRAHDGATPYSAEGTPVRLASELRY